MFRSHNLKPSWLFLIPMLVYAGSAPADPLSTDPQFYKPVIDFNARLGNQRDILRVEMQTPLAQNRDQMIFSDIRTVWGSDSGHELNFGLGYRQVTEVMGEDYVLGGYGFYDRRTSQFGNDFSQWTIGAEALGEKYRFRTNFYEPISGSKLISDTPDSASLTPEGFVLVNPGITREVPLRGFDVEAGFRIPYLQDYPTWLHASYYNFGQGEDVDLDGVRLRAETDVSDHIRLGYEYSHDNIRNTNHFFDVRLRIPLQQEKYTRPKGIYRYMQEPIVRDIDVVTNPKAQASKTEKNKNGKTEQYIFVDNSLTANGDGTPNNPYNNLIDAQTALSNGNTSKTIYVRQGNGTASNMNTGITMDFAGARLVGSGVDLETRAGVFIEAATTSPVITNTSGDAAYTDNKNYTLTLSNNDTSFNDRRGTYIRAYNGADVSVSASGLTANGNTSEGVRFEAGGGNSTITASVQNITTNGNGGVAGFYIVGASNTSLDITANSVQSQQNSGHGVYAQLGGTGNHVFTADDISTALNGNDGMRLDTQDSATSIITTTNTSSANNGDDGLNITSRADTEVTVSISNHTSSYDGQQGVDVTADGTSTVMIATLDQLFIDHAANSGLFLRSRSGGTLNATLSDSKISDNAATGLFIEAAGNGNTDVSVTNTDVINSASLSLYLLNNTSGIFNANLNGNNGFLGGGTYDIFANLNGLTVDAGNNWWGQAGGPDPAKVSLISGGSVITAPALGSNPRP